MFVDFSNKIYIKIIFTDVLSQMPSYAKKIDRNFIKEKKDKGYETITLTIECSALIQNKFSPKLKDPDSFSIPCVI